MNTVISHQSALEYWRSVAGFRLPYAKPTSAIRGGAALCAQEAEDLRQTLGLRSPLHLLATRTDKRPNTRGVTFHTRTTPLPKGSLMRIADTVLVASPELCFVQAPDAPNLPLAVALGYELCGTYPAGPNKPGRSRVQLTSPAKLATYMQRATGLHGIAAARRASQYILLGSASPMETILSMLATLPLMYGGCALSRPSLNHRIDPGKRTCGMVGQQYFKCDLYWEKARLAVEYDSNLHHTGASQIAHDSKRRGELSALDITVITMTTGQLFNPREFNRVMRTIAKRLGERAPRWDRQYAERQRALRATLFAGLLDGGKPVQSP